jgi:hypothetical protein
MDKLKAIIKKKKYGAYRAQGVDLKKDADRPALPTGKRISKNGNTYYEYRANRIDVKQPPKRYPKLADGGFVSKGQMVWNKISNSEKMEFLKENFTPEITPRSQEGLVGKSYKFLPRNVKIKFEAKYANVEEYAKGGKTKKVTTPEEYYEKKERAFQNALKNLDSFDFEMFSEEGNDAVRKEVQKAFDKIDDLEKKPSKDWALRLKRQIISNVEDDFQEVDDTEPGTNISVLLDYKLKQKGYDFGDDYWDYLYYKYAKGGYMAKGGELKEDDFVWNEVGKKLVVDKVTDTEYFLKGFMQTSTSPFSKNKVDTYIKLGKWSLKPKMADGGVIYLESVGTYFRPSDLATSSEESFSNEGEIVDLADIDNEEWFNALSEKDRATIEKYKAKGGYMADGGELHRSQEEKFKYGGYMAGGGSVFSEKELKEVLSNAVYHFYKGLNEVEAAMSYLDRKGQGGLKTALSKKFKLEDLKESIEKMDKYTSIEKEKGGYMAEGGMSQGYDDREDEKLSMKHGKISTKDFVGSLSEKERSRRDDAQFEERMAMGGAIEHGLKKGDHIMVVRGNMLGIKNEITGEIVTLNIETGERKESKE